MRFFFISKQGDSAGLAVAVRLEGHEVYWYCDDKRADKLLDGLILKVGSIREGADKSPDVFVFDMVGFGKIADQIKKDGGNVLGGGKWNDKLELDRAFAVRTMETFGIRTPASWHFDSYMEAARWAAKQRKRLVFKPHNNADTAHTYVSKDVEDLVAFITHLKKDLKEDGPCLLQEFIEGTEVSTEYWFANGKPVPFPNGTVEVKSLMGDGWGPPTGAQVSVVWPYKKKEPRIVQQSLKKLFYFIEKTRYSGPIDINGIVRNKRFYGLEFSPRLGYSAIYAFLRLLNEPIGDFLYRIATGDNSPIDMKEGFGYSLRVSVPPYPFAYDENDKKLSEKSRGLLVLGVDKKDWGRRVFPLDVYADKIGIKTAGVDGCVLECTGFGTTPVEAEIEAYDLACKIVLPNKMATIGAGAPKTENVLSELSLMGYETPNYLGIEEVGNGTKRQGA